MRNDIPKDELVVKSIRLAQTIPDQGKRNACIASVFAFASKYLSRERMNELLEVLKMTNLALKLVEDAIEDKAIEIARNALREGSSTEFTKKITGLDDATIAQLKTEIENE